MALSLSLSMSRKSQSITGNYSTVSWALKFTKSSGTFNNNGVSYYVNIGGKRQKTSTYKFTKGTTSGTIASGTATVSHNSDGTYGTCNGYAYVGPTNFSPSSASASNSVSLPTIPRTSTLSLSKSSVPADGSTTITATAKKQSSSFTDTIVVKLGSYSKTVTSGSAFTIPLSWNNAISGTSAVATVTVTTKSGSTTIGKASKNLTITVPNSVIPTINDVSIAEAVSEVTTAFGDRYVKSKSQLNISISASGIYGSTIKSYSTKIDGVTYTGATFKTNALKTSGTLNVVTTVTDSRGRTATLTKTITVVEYTPPSITAMLQISCDSAGNEDPEGEYTKVTISGSVASVDEQNSRTLTLKYKEISETAYSDPISLSTSAWNFEVSTIISGTDPTTTWEFVANLSDKLTSVGFAVSSGKPTISRYAGGNGVTLFAEAESEGFKVAGGKESTFTGNVNLTNPLTIANGGTGANTAIKALQALGLKPWIAGDTMTTNFMGATLLSNSKKSIYLYLPVKDPILADSVECTSAKLTTVQDGSYTHGSASGSKVAWTVSSTEITETGIYILLTRSTVTNATNNAPIAFNGDFTIKFS